MEEWRLAHRLEGIFHGTPSGVDTGLAVMEGTCAFQPHPPDLPAFERLPCPLPGLVVAAVPRDASCGALIADLGRRLGSGDRSAIRAIDSLGEIAAAARNALRRCGGDAAAPLAGLADDAMGLLRGLGLSTPALDALLDAGRRAGALGGKLSGAGGGGAFFLVVRDAREAREVARCLQEEGGRRDIRFVSRPRFLGMGAAAGAAAGAASEG
jgi:mevalonate kinase